MDYKAFLESKQHTVIPTGITEHRELNPALFPYQQDIVRWALKRGRAAIFAGCGLGKTLMQLEWAKHVSEVTGGDILVLAPLAVNLQTVAEGERFGISVNHARSQADIKLGINITNYEMLHHFDTDHFVGVVPDECFTHDTQIQTPSGYKSISEFKIGDQILNCMGIDIVSDIHKREVSYAVRLEFNGRKITCSPNHPFFTQRGWIGAQDISPTDSIISTRSAMRLVHGEFSSDEPTTKNKTLLRSILFSEMAYEYTGAQSQSTHARNSGQAGNQQKQMAKIGISNGYQGIGTNKESEPNAESGHKGQSVIPIESHEAQTFRAWGEWNRNDRAAAIAEGCNFRDLDSGICYLTGPTASGISHALQSRLSESRAENSYRSGWKQPLRQKESGHQEGFEIEFFRVDSLEILEQGHPELDQYRDADGKLYFYDLGATFHPSFTVNDALVHNSSIIKSYDSKTTDMLLTSFAKTPFKLACTATPSPNDFMELGNHAEFLGVMSRVEMLATFFVHDGGETSKWRLKGHAAKDFWKWLCKWSVMVHKPSDLGYSDDGFILPPLNTHHYVVDSKPSDGQLFAFEAKTLQERQMARKASIDDRITKCAEIVNASDQPFLIWCNLNEEADKIQRLIPGSVNVQGSDSSASKEKNLMGFTRGDYRVLISKPKLAGFGMNWQHCNQVAYVGLSDSFEQYYQSVRRCYRFGQERPVDVHIITSEAEGAVVSNINKKEAKAQEMSDRIMENMRDEMNKEIHGMTKETDDYKEDFYQSPKCTLYMGDCVEKVKLIADESIDYSIFSPPFSSLYTYSNSIRDMGNCRNDEDFMTHFTFMVKDLFRVLKSGRLVSFHCMNLPTSKQNHGYIGIRDFRGELIKMFQDVGFIYHSEVVIWKDPVVAMQRTKALGLLYKQLKKDSAMSRQGIPDYLVTMRKPGVNPDPVTKDPDDFPVQLWQQYASPIWMDIDPSDTLQYRSAREHEDERHICPLQTQVIRRALKLWTNPGDLVLTPFLGIGSEAVVALEEGRRAVGIELKQSYFGQARKNCEFTEKHKKDQLTLFDFDAMDDGVFTDVHADPDDETPKAPEPVKSKKLKSKSLPIPVMD